MIIRVKFGKEGALRFIGHLDVLRTFQKIFRRADIPMAYSQGFSPHPIMSFALPLGLGLSSEGEYLDAEIVWPEEPGGPPPVSFADSPPTKGGQATGGGDSCPPPEAGEGGPPLKAVVGGGDLPGTYIIQRSEATKDPMNIASGGILRPAASE